MIPGAPTVTGVTPGDTEATVAFTAPTDDGGSAILEYEAEAATVTSLSSPVAVPIAITVTGNYGVPVEANVLESSGTGPISTIIVRPPRPPAEWVHVLCDEAGRQTLPLDPESIRLTFTRNRPPEVEAVVDVADEVTSRVVQILANGLPRLRSYRRGDTTTLGFYGRWAPMQEQVSAEGDDDATLLFRGPGGGLERRWTDATLTYTQQTEGAILWDLVARENTKAPTGIVQGTIDAGELRDRTYENKNVGEAIIELTEVEGGPDFEVTPTHDPNTPAILGTLNVYQRQGQDRSQSVVFEFGADTAGTITSVRRNIQLPVNRVRVLGQDPGDGTPPLVAEVSDQASIDKYGLFMERIDATDVSVLATLTAKAQAALRPEPVRVLEFDPDPDTAPRPFDDFWLGDTVTLRVRSGSVFEDETVRVNQIVVTPDDTGREDYTIAVEAPEAEGPLMLPRNWRRPYERVFAEQRRDLRALAQRVHAP